MSSPKHVLFVLLEDFTHLAFANGVEPLRIANMIAGETLYNWTFASENGAHATASNGVRVAVDQDLSGTFDADYLFVVSGLHVQRRVTPALQTALRRARSRGVTLGGLCSGAYALAETGLLDGHQAAIHWEFHEPLSEAYPEVTVAKTVFVADGRILSASGGAATADLMLHLIGEHHGEEMSLAVSEQMVYTAVRAGSAEQKVSVLARHGSRNARLAEAIRIMRQNIEEPLTTAQVADEIGVSTRQLERLFAQHLKTSPRRYMMELRLERARSLLIHTDMSVIEIGLACGFVSSSHFSRVYAQEFGTRPTQQRRHFQ